jgi:hypothetical protein
MVFFISFTWILDPLSLIQVLNYFIYVNIHFIHYILLLMIWPVSIRISIFMFWNAPLFIRRRCIVWWAFGCPMGIDNYSTATIIFSLMIFLNNGFLIFFEILIEIYIFAIIYMNSVILFVNNAISIYRISFIKLENQKIKISY